MSLKKNQRYVIINVEKLLFYTLCLLIPVRKHGKRAVLAYEVAEHADLLWSKKLQGQRLTWDQNESDVGKNRQVLHTVLVMQGTAVKLLHVWAQILHNAHTNEDKDAIKKNKKKTLDDFFL